MKKTQTLKAILYGMGTNFRKSIDYLSFRFIIVGCSDKDMDKASVARQYELEYIPPRKLCKVEYDYILITSIYGEKIKEELMSDFNIDEKKILTMDVWQKMEFFHSFGDKNPEKTFYLISKPIRANNGIISLLYMYLDLLSRVDGKDYIPVIDLQTYKNQYLEKDEVGRVNAWEKFFEPISPYSVDDVMQSQNVILGYDDPGYLCNYETKYDLLIMAKMFKKYIHFKPAVQELIDYEKSRTIGDKEAVIGVLYRGTDMTALKLKQHMIQPSLEELYDRVKFYKEKWNCDKVYISTEDLKAIEYFKEREGENLVYTNQLRYENTGNNWLADIDNNRENDKFIRGAEYIATIYLLSECDYLISGVVAGSIGAMIMNGGRYKDVCIIDKGAY